MPIGERTFPRHGEVGDRRGAWGRARGGRDPRRDGGQPTAGSVWSEWNGPTSGEIGATAASPRLGDGDDLCLSVEAPTN
jgi:hypothetical protein